MKTMKMPRINLKERTIDHLIQGILIFTSVFFAIFVNDIAEGIKTSNKKKEALENIKKELEINSAVINDWIALHTQILDRIVIINDGRNDSLKNELSGRKRLNLSLLTNGKSLADTAPSGIAWETAKTTGIITEFDFKTIQRLTDVYTLQNIIVEKTFMKIIDFAFDSNSYNEREIDITLIQLELLFRELTGQEHRISELYGLTLSDL